MQNKKTFSYRKSKFVPKKYISYSLLTMKSRTYCQKTKFSFVIRQIEFPPQNLSFLSIRKILRQYTDFLKKKRSRKNNTKKSFIIYVKPPDDYDIARSSILTKFWIFHFKFYYMSIILIQTLAEKPQLSPFKVLVLWWNLSTKG